MKNLIKNNIIIIILVLLIVAAIIISKKNKLPMNDVAVNTEVTDQSLNSELPSYSEKRSITITNVSKDLQNKTVDVTGTATLVYFEGTFPAQLLDENRNEIWQGYASAQTDWMTENPVDFLLIIDAQYIPSGEYTLVLGDGSPADPSETGRPPFTVESKITI